VQLHLDVDALEVIHVGRDGREALVSLGLDARSQELSMGN
jgi:hypothetical protein